MLNLTPHAITIRHNEVDTTIEPSGSVARVSTSSVDAGVCPVTGAPIIKTIYGDVEGLGSPSDGPVLVSALVLGRLGPEWSGVAFAPATGPADGAIRNDKGHIVAVTKLVTV